MLGWKSNQLRPAPWPDNASRWRSVASRRPDRSRNSRRVALFVRAAIRSTRNDDADYELSTRCATPNWARRGSRISGDDPIFLIGTPRPPPTDLGRICSIVFNGAFNRACRTRSSKSTTTQLGRRQPRPFISDRSRRLQAVATNLTSAGLALCMSPPVPLR